MKSKRKKLLSIVLVFIMIFLSSAVAAAATETVSPVIIAGASAGEPGARVNIPITVEGMGSSEYDTAFFIITYPAGNLTVQESDITYNTVFNQFTIDLNEAGKIKIYAGNTEGGHAGNAQICTVGFTVKSGASSISEIGIVKRPALGGGEAPFLENTSDGTAYSNTTAVFGRITVAAATASVTSATYTVNDTANVIINRKGNTPLNIFLTNLAPVENSTFKLYLADGVTEANAVNVASGMKLIVTAKDGIAQKIYSVYVTGDVNGDGFINATDGADILKHFVKVITVAYPAAADTNKDGFINATDTADILKYFVKGIQFID